MFDLGESFYFGELGTNLFRKSQSVREIRVRYTLLNLDIRPMHSPCYCKAEFEQRRSHKAKTLAPKPILLLHRNGC